MADLQLNRLSSILNPPISSQGSKIADSENAKESFGSILSKEIQDNDSVKFSKHAQSRLESRNISLEQEDLQKLSDAVGKASEKGVQDSLILMNNLAFIVSVPAKTVVTAMPVSEAADNIFTNIDGAVII